MYNYIRNEERDPERGTGSGTRNEKPSNYVIVYGERGPAVCDTGGRVTLLSRCIIGY